MSRAFVKEDAQGPDEDPPERPLSTLPNYCTPRGLSMYHAEEERLIAALESYEGAQDDPVRRKEKRVLERDLRWVRARMEAAIPVDPAHQPKEQARFGASVTLRDGDGKERRVRIAGEDEAAADASGVATTWASPLVEAMLGLRAGESFEHGGTRWTVAAVWYD